MTRLPSFLLLCCGIALLSGAGTLKAPEAHSDPQRIAYLRKQMALFQSFSPAKQQRIRELDQQIHSQSEEKVQHFHKVMENYAIWLDHLSELDRKKISEPGILPEDRLVLIRRLRQQEWIESLPESYRKTWEEVKGNAGERAKLVDLWREEQESRDIEWLQAQKYYSEQGKENLIRLFENPDVKENLEPYLKNLVRAVLPAEKEMLAKARLDYANGLYFDAGRVIYAISERYPLLPGTENYPRNFDTLPANVKAILPDPKDKPINQPFRLATAKFIGRWPDYPKAITRYTRDQKLKLPQEFGPCKLSELPETVRTFVEKKLYPELAKAENGRNDQKMLTSLEGMWPEYPEKLMELARTRRMTVPGWSLPAHEQWNANFRVVKKAKN